VTATGNGTVTSTDGFINCPGTCSHTYPNNTQVTLNATPAQGWSFTGWSGACSGTGSCVVTMTQAQSVVGTFTQLSFPLTVTPTGNGTVTSTDGFINCPGTCSHSYLSNTQVTLSATPAQGWGFTGWTGACTGTGSCIVTMSQAQSVGATFTQLSFTLTVTPTGSGTIASSDGFINCPGTCSHSYLSDTQVTLNATPAQGWSFTGWSGACTGVGSCVLTMAQAQSATATFTQNSYQLTASVSGSGAIASTDGFINCPGTCSHRYLSNTQVTLNATPVQGWSFTGWSGSCTGTGSCVITMTQAQSVTANFKQNSYQLTASVSGSGTITSADGFINCGSACTHTYSSNTSVTLTATPAQGWSFTGWSGACTGTGSCAVTMTQAQSVIATFTQQVVVSSLSFSPSSLVGPGSATGTVTLSAAAPSGGASVSLSSNNANVQVPATMTVAAGASSGTFSAAASSVTSQVTATVTATYNQVSVNSTLTVLTPQPVVTLSTTAINFGGQFINTSSAAATVTLTNSGATALSISSVTVLGDSSEFSQTNNCASTIAPNTSCSFSISFTPSSAGIGRSASLAITDNASGSPHVVSLTGVGTSFGLGVAPRTPSSATVQAGSDAAYTLTVGGAGVTGTAFLSCTGLPSGATCNPSSLNFDGTTAGTTMLTISTTPRTVGLLHHRDMRPGPWWGLAIFGVVAIPYKGVRRKKAMLGITSLCLLMLFISSCGGGGSSSGGGQTSSAGTPAGTYTVSVAAVQGTDHQNVTLTLVVQ
jgi:uncharacterized repeat protein (TIGR02543 family)